MNYNENTYTSIQCRLLLSMYIIIMYYNNTGMYHEPRHALEFTCNTVIVELNSIQMATLKQSTICCKISIKVSTCNVNMSILASIHINKN